MARTKLSASGTDLVNDSGNITWSMIQGEQLEMEIDLAMISGAPTGYTYECEYMEAIDGMPLAGGTSGTLVVRRLNYRGTWNLSTEYQLGDSVSHAGKVFMRVAKAEFENLEPGTSALTWQETTMNTVFIQFPSSFSESFSVSPTPETPVYALFELKIAESISALELGNSNGLLARVWKPVRGQIEILFSPTKAVV